jgi:hypothetical protein
MNLFKFLCHTKWGADQQNLIKIHRMIVLSTLRYGEKAYKKTRNHTQQKVNVSPWTIRNLSNQKCFVRVQTTYPGRSAVVEQRENDNPNHQKLKTNRTDEYAYRPATPKPLFVRASETLRKLKIDPRRIEKTAHQTTVDRAPNSQQ